MKLEPKDEAYVSNYPPLDAWIRENDGRCAWQVLVGKRTSHHAYVECWQFGSRTALVVVHSHRRGWNVYTEASTNGVLETLADASNRIGR